MHLRPLRGGLGGDRSNDRELLDRGEGAALEA
jgi:hypothetical protein